MAQPHRSNGRPVRAGVDTFKSDPLFPRVERAVASILAKEKVVAPVDVLVAMQLLRPEHLTDWRRGRVPPPGRDFLKIPLPQPQTAQRLAEARGGLLAGLRRSAPGR